MTPGLTSLRRILDSSGVGLEPRALERLWRYHGLLRAANAELNLTRIHQFENMVRKHYVDSLLVLRLVDPPAPLLDMGSGAGLPGVPLAIARPDLKVILCEPRGARVRFLEQVVRELELKNAEIYPHKLDARFQGSLGGVISRAVGPIPDGLRRACCALEPGGLVLFMKGPDCDREIAEARETLAASFDCVLDQAYAIPHTSHERRLVVYKRIANDCGKAAPAGRFRAISSRSNEQFQLFESLLTGAGIRKHGLALIAGVRLRDEMLARFPEAARGWLGEPDHPPPPLATLDWFKLSKPLFRQLDVSGTHAPLLVVQTPEIPEWSDQAPWPAGCTLFVPFQDPENVGAVIRSAAAFGASRVVLLRGSAHPFHPRSCRAAGPALFQVRLETGPALHELEGSGAPLIALDTTGQSLEDAPFPERFGLVVGVEGPGLPAHLRAGERRRIPIAEGVESLNAAAAAAIALYAWNKQRPQPSEGARERC